MIIYFFNNFFLGLSNRRFFPGFIFKFFALNDRSECQFVELFFVPDLMADLESIPRRNGWR